MKLKDIGDMEIAKIGAYLVGIAVVVSMILVCGMALYDSGHSAGISETKSTQTALPTPTPTPTVTPPPTPSPIAYITDVQSVGTDYGYVCLVDGNGKEYLVMNFDPGTAELLHASYSGTIVGSYNGIPELENVALTAYPNYDYYQNDDYHQIRTYTGNYEYNDRIYRNGYDRKVKCAGTMVCG